MYDRFSEAYKPEEEVAPERPEVVLPEQNARPIIEIESFITLPDSARFISSGFLIPPPLPDFSQEMTDEERMQTVKDYFQKVAKSPLPKFVEKEPEKKPGPTTITTFPEPLPVDDPEARFAREQQKQFNREKTALLAEIEELFHPTEEDQFPEAVALTSVEYQQLRVELNHASTLEDLAVLRAKIEGYRTEIREENERITFRARLISDIQSEKEIIDNFPEEFPDKQWYLKELLDLLARVQDEHVSIEDLRTIQDDLGNLSTAAREQLQAYLDQKEDEQYPKTFGDFLKVVGKFKGAENKFNVFTNYILGKGKNERADRAEQVKDFAMDLATSGATSLALLAFHPDPDLILKLSIATESALLFLFSVSSATTLGTELLEGKSQKFRMLSRKIARSIPGKYGHAHSSQYLREFTGGISKVARRLQPSIVVGGLYGAIAGADQLHAQMVQATQNANLANQQTDHSNLLPPHVTVTGPTGNGNNGGSTEWMAPNSAGNPTILGNEPLPPTLPPEILGVNGIDWSRIAGDTAWDKILNYTLKMNPDIHLPNAATNGAKNLLLELAKLNNPQATTPDQMLRALEHVDVRKLLQAIDVVNDQHFSVSALGRGTDPNEVTAILRRISTGVGAHSPQEMYLNAKDADLLVKAFRAPYLPTP